MIQVKAPPMRPDGFAVVARELSTQTDDRFQR